MAFPAHSLEYSNGELSAQSSVDDRGLYHLSKSLKLTGDLKGVGFLITSSNITLDCSGATLYGMGTVPSGILVDSRGKNISNIVIKNCIFQDFKYNGIRIGWSIFDYLKPLLNLGDLYNSHPSFISISDVDVINSGTTGIYIDDYVSNVVVDRVSVSDSGGVGLYLEHGSKKNIIRFSKFYDNGRKIKREGIAVDASYQNVITNNYFSRNGAGSVFLYKNCQEHFSSGKAAVRLFGANENTIKNNYFFREKIGVWVASRQSRDLSKFDCGVESLSGNKYYLDFADHNSLIGNNFCDVAHGVVVEGDYNSFIDNVFEGVFEESFVRPITGKQRFTGIAPVGNKYGFVMEKRKTCTADRSNKMEFFE